MKFKRSKHASENPDIVAGSGSNKKTFSFSKQRMRTIMLGAVGIAVLGLVVWVGYSKFIKPQKLSNGTTVKKLTPDQLTAQTNALIGHGKFDDVKKLAKYQDYADTDLKTQLTIVLAYVNQNDHQGALEFLQGTEKQFGNNYTVTRLIGQQYEALGNKDKAITYYNKTIELLKNDKTYELASEDIAEMQQAIKRLEQK